MDGLPSMVKKGIFSNASIQSAWTASGRLLLGHLSSENNTPEMAYRVAHAALTQAGAQVGEDVSLHVAARYRASYLYRLA